MKIKKIMLKIEIAVFIIFIVFVLSSTGWTATYYASPNGGGNSCTQSNPCKVSTALNNVQAGETVLLMDGIYSDAGSMIKPPVGKSGTAGSPITIKGLNPGKALINGQNARMPVHLNSNNYFNIEDINAYNAGGSGNRIWVVAVRASNNVNVRRIVAWDTNPDVNSNIFNIGESQNVLVEDCAGWGDARKIFSPRESNGVTFRRNFGRWTRHNKIDPTRWGQYETMSFSYWSRNIRLENNIMTWDQTGNFMNDPYPKGLIADDNSYSNGGYSFFGNIVYHLSSQNGNPEALFNASKDPSDAHYTMENNLAYTDKKNGINTFVLKNKNHQGSHLTSIGGGNGVKNRASSIYEELGDISHIIQMGSGGPGVNLGSKTDYVTSWNNVGANFQSGTPANYVNENPDLIGRCGDILQYGCTEAERPKTKGQSTGAQIKYRYVDGVLTNEPLWPWPMNERIKEAMMQSGYDQKGGLDGKGGIDLTKIIFELGGGTLPPELSSGTYQCSDGLDNDGDSLIDYPNDPGCSSSIDNDEYHIPDNDSPSNPSGLTANAVSSSQINLSWNASTDNVGVAGYRIYRNGSQVGTSTSTTYSDTGLSPLTTYTYSVEAYDAAGNSALSSSATATTLDVQTDTISPSPPANLHSMQN